MKNKLWRNLLVFFSLLLFFAVLPLTCSAVSGTCGDNLTWSYEGTTLTISGQGEMVIKDHAPWDDCQKTCTKVIIEEGVTSIGFRAFSHFKNLYQIIIPDTVTKIEDSAFSHCGLTELPLTEHITEVGSYAFENCDFYEATISSNIKVISYGMLSGCKIRNLTISQGITEIQSYAFSGCNFLTTVVIPDSVTTVGSSAFSGCTGLKNITLGKSITAITNSMFSDCTSLESIVIPDSVQMIDDYAFNNCKRLSSVALGAGVTEVSEWAFQKTPALNRVTLSEANPYLHEDNGVLYTEDLSTLVMALPNFSGKYTVLPGTKKIGPYAFFESQGLEQITLPDSVTSIDTYAFNDCKNLTQINFGSCLETIEEFALAGCSGLEELELPSTVRQIGVGAFRNCSGLKTVHFAGGYPAMTGAIFGNVKAIVYYPAYHPTWNQNDSEKKIRDYILAVMSSNNIIMQPVMCRGEHGFGDWTADADGKTVRLCTICGKQDGEATQTGDTLPGLHFTPPTIGGAEQPTETTAQTQETQPEGIAQTESAAIESVATETTGDSQPKESVQTEAAEMVTTGETQLDTPEETQNGGSSKWVAWMLVSVIIVAGAAVGGFYFYKSRKKQ